MLSKLPQRYAIGGWRMVKVTARGSTLVMVLCVMTAITMVATVALRNSAYGLDLSLQRLQYEQQFRAVDGLMQYAIAATQENYDSLSRVEQPIVIPFDAWPPMHNQAPYKGTIIIKAQEGILLRAELARSGGLVCALCCTVLRIEKGGKQDFYVSNWRSDGDFGA